MLGFILLTALIFTGFVKVNPVPSSPTGIYKIKLLRRYKLFFVDSSKSTQQITLNLKNLLLHNSSN